MQIKAWYLVLLFSIGYFCVSAELDIDIGDANDALAATSDALEKFVDIIKDAEPAKILAKVSKSLAMLGPAMMAVSAALSIVTMFLPKEDSPELKAITAGFEKVNNKLDVLSNDIMNLENVVKLSAAKSAYATSVTIIRENHRIYSVGVESKSQSDMEYFKLNYENTYGMATTHLYDALVGKNGAFGFNMIKLYSDSEKCNPVKISQFCVMGMDMINKGLACESAYLGTLNFTAQVKAKQQMWKKNLEDLSKQCESIVSTCEAEWETRSQSEFINSYKKYMSGDHANYAKQIVSTIAEIVPQRKWFAVVYSDAGGFGEHCYSSYYKVSKVWNENSRDVSLFSTPQSKVSDDELKKWTNDMENKVKAVNSDKYCSNKGWISKNSGNESRSLVEIIRESYYNGVVYSVDARKNPAAKISSGNLFEKRVKWACKNSLYHLMIFQ